MPSKEKDWGLCLVGVPHSPTEDRPSRVQPTKELYLLVALTHGCCANRVSSTASGDLTQALSHTIGERGSSSPKNKTFVSTSMAAGLHPYYQPHETHTHGQWGGAQIAFQQELTPVPLNESPKRFLTLVDYTGSAGPAPLLCPGSRAPHGRGAEMQQGTACTVHQPA